MIFAMSHCPPVCKWCKQASCYCCPSCGRDVRDEHDPHCPYVVSKDEPPTRQPADIFSELPQYVQMLTEEYSDDAQAVAVMAFNAGLYAGKPK